MRTIARDALGKPTPSLAAAVIVTADAVGVQAAAMLAQRNAAQLARQATIDANQVAADALAFTTVQMPKVS